jgi:hypothetical protein
MVFGQGEVVYYRRQMLDVGLVSVSVSRLTVSAIPLTKPELS